MFTDSRPYELLLPVPIDAKEFAGLCLLQRTGVLQVDSLFSRHVQCEQLVLEIFARSPRHVQLHGAICLLP